MEFGYSVLYAVVIIVGIVAGVIVRLFALRLFGLKGVSIAVRTGALVVALSGLLIGLYGANQLVESWERRHWSTVEGTVVRSELVGGRNYRPEIELEYDVEGATYRVVSNLGATGFGSKRSRYDVGKHLIADYPPGRRVSMHYDSAHPARAVLLVRPRFQSFVLVAVGILLLAVGGAIASLPRSVDVGDGASGPGGKVADTVSE